MTTQSLPRPNAAHSLPVHFRRLYRAHITPRAHDYRGPELTAFVEASSREGAVRKIAAAIVAAMEFGSTAESVAERIYNCNSAQECIDDGLSEDVELRLFETGWSGNKAICFVEHPLFLLANPAPLCRKWAQCPRVTR
jgi:hypothetical protein